jgi:hypothetical protein
MALVTTLVLVMIQAVFIMPVSADGNVNAMVVDGNLIIKGDALGNRFTVLGRTTNNYEVTGEDGTTVNGLPMDILEVTGEVVISTKAGNDRPRIDGHIRKVTINTGPGNDRIDVGDPVVSGDLIIETGPGNDIVDIQDTSILQKLVVDTGTGNDHLHIFFVNITDDAIIRMGRGEDSAEMIKLNINGAIIFED